jgi:hypothetical protein
VIIVVVVSFGDETSAALGDDEPRRVSVSRVAATVIREKRMRTPDYRPPRLLASLAPSAGHGKVPLADRTNLPIGISISSDREIRSSSRGLP